MIAWRSEVAQPCPTLCDPVDCSPPGSSIHGILQARVLERVAISFSRGSSPPRDRTRVSHVTGRPLNFWATREVPCRHGCVGGGGVSRGCLWGSAFQSSRRCGLWPRGHLLGAQHPSSHLLPCLQPADGATSARTRTTSVSVCACRSLPRPFPVRLADS